MKNTEVFRLAVAQMTSIDETQANLAVVQDLYGRASGADLVVFPENTLFFRIQSGSRIAGCDLESAEIKALRKTVDSSAAALMVTTPLRTGDRLTNSTILFRPGKAPEVVYSKIHLFDVDVPGAPPV